MTHFMIRTAMVGLAACAVAACATAPQYPTQRGNAERPFEAPTPNFPIQPGPAAALDEDGNPIPAAQPTTPVESAPLAPPPGTVAAPAPVESVPLTPMPEPEAAAAPPPPPAPVVQTRTVMAVAGKVVDAAGRPQVTEVRSGEGLDAVARRLGTSRKQLADDNNLKPPYRLQPGQDLKGPAVKGKAYVVGAGDTLYAIARRFSVKAGDLAQLNDFEVSDSIRPGQKILLPSGFKDTGPITRVITERVTPEAPAPTVGAAAPPVYTPPPPVLRPALPAAQPPAARPLTPAVPRPVVAEPRTTPSTPPVVARPYTPGPSQIPAAPAARPIIETAAPPTDNEVASAGQGRFAWPVHGDVASAFGPKGMGQRNDGMNIKAASGTAVRAAAGGEVVYAGDQVPGFGNLVLVKHDGGWVTAYAHMSRIDVKMRDRVTQGQQLGQVGATGGVSEPQLHFEVRYAPSPKDKARPIDPALVLPR